MLAFPGADADQIAATCERIRENLVLALSSGATPAFTASYGIATWTPGTTVEELVSRADQALYRAKNHGRNRTVVLDPSGRETEPRTAQSDPTPEELPRP